MPVDPAVRTSLAFGAMHIEPATAADLPAIHAAYADARAIQESQRSPLWADFADELLLREIAEGRLLRVMDGAVLAGVFTVAYDDRAIWGELERGEHIYLHRISRAAGFPGRGLVGTVLAWTWARCEAMQRSGLRIDTWASNDALVALYVRHGFHIVGRHRIGVEPSLPTHYQGTELTLLEAPRRATTA